MKRWLWLTVLALLGSSHMVLSQETQVFAQSAPVLREQGGFTTVARVENNALKLRVLEYGAPYRGIVHAYFVAKDFSKLYFDYPDEDSKGSYSLAMPEMEAGMYDLIIEITGGAGHEHEKPRFVQVFPLGWQGIVGPSLESVQRLALKSTNANLKPAGQPSSFELSLLLDGAPVAWGPYYVHQFVIKTDWSYFKHDHPKNVKELGAGSVQSAFTFPSSGEYALFQFIETGVKVDGEKLRPVITFPTRLTIP
jgi:hypothetical protein